MKTILFIFSLTLLHYPLGVFKDTLRRYNRIKLHGNEEVYEIKNGIIPNMENNPIYNFEGIYISLLGAFVLALYPAFKVMSFSWFFIILINVLISLFISQILAFITTPFMSIKNRNQIGKEAYLSVGLGVLLSLIASLL